MGHASFLSESSAFCVSRDSTKVPSMKASLAVPASTLCLHFVNLSLSDVLVLGNLKTK